MEVLVKNLAVPNRTFTFNHLYAMERIRACPRPGQNQKSSHKRRNLGSWTFLRVELPWILIIMRK